MTRLPSFATEAELLAWAQRKQSTDVVTRIDPSEEQEQMALVARARLHEGTYPALRLLFHVPNGGSRHVVEAKKLKALGVLAGVPDLILLYAAHDFHGWCGEMKVKGGAPTSEQKRIINELKRRGYFAEFFYTQEAAWQSLLWYVKP